MNLIKAIENEVQKPRFSSKSTLELIEIVENNTKLSKLFNSLNENAALKKLLFLHRIDLFGFESDMLIPYFYFCNQPKRSEKQKSEVSKTLKGIVKHNTSDIEQRGKSFIKEIIGIENDLIADVADISAYFFIHYARVNPEFLNLMNAEKFSFTEMKATLKDYKDVITVPDYLVTLIEGKDKPIDPIVLDKIFKLVIKVTSTLMSNPDKNFAAVNNSLPDIDFIWHHNSKYRVNEMLELTQLNYNEYRCALDDLYRLGLIESNNTITWCESCSTDHPTYNKVSAKLSPEKFTRKQKCLSCDNSSFMNFGAIYDIDTELKQILLSQDGILPVYLCWMLKQKNVSFSANSKGANYELDVLVRNNMILECKTLKQNKDALAIKTELSKNCLQVIRQVEAKRKEGIEIKKAFVVWNKSQEEISEIVESVIEANSNDSLELFFLPFDRISDFTNRIN